MTPKTITYKRIYNLGNYESKHLEECDELSEDEDVDEAISRLMERVERKIREVAHREIEEEIKQSKKLLRELKEQIAKAETELSILQPKPQEADNIPIDAGSPTSDNPAYF